MHCGLFFVLFPNKWRAHYMPIACIGQYQFWGAASKSSIGSELGSNVCERCCDVFLRLAPVCSVWPRWTSSDPDCEVRSTAAYLRQISQIHPTFFGIIRVILVIRGWPLSHLCRMRDLYQLARSAIDMGNSHFSGQVHPRERRSNAHSQPAGPANRRRVSW